MGEARPVRTCIGCRQRCQQSDLLRVVIRGSAVIPDDHDRQSGRGAYLHPTPECLDAAKRRRAFARALRVSGPLSVAAVEQTVLKRSTTK